MAVTSRNETRSRRSESRSDTASGADRTSPARRSLAFEGTVDRTSAGWIVRVPVRSEDVWVEKQTFVVEEIRVSGDEHVHTTKVERQTRREELRVENVPQPRRLRTPRGK